MPYESSESSSGATAISLVASLQARDEQGWERFVYIYGPLIYSWCRKAGVAEADAGDLLQQILGKIHVSISSFHKSSPADTFRGWLATITRHAIVDFFRKQRQHAVGAGGTEAWQQLNNIPAQVDLSSESQDQNVRELALRAFQVIESELPEQSRRLLELTVFEEKSAAEAAQILGMTPSAVRKAKSRMLRKLREMLGEFD
jgi:RNA polymerase sigma-70 factor (ECF subfamily)